MTFTTCYQEFQTACATQKIVTVCRELFTDAETPVQIYRKLAADRQGTFLLESAAQGTFDRYSFIGVNSFGYLSEKAGFACWQQAAGSPLTAKRLLPSEVSKLTPLAAVKQVHENWYAPAPKGLPALVSGLVGYLGWETIAELESSLISAPDNVAVPRQFLNFVADLVVIDHATGSVILVANVLCDQAGSDPQILWQQAQERLDAMQQQLAKPQAAPVAVRPAAALDALFADSVQRHTSSAEYAQQVAKIKTHIVDGDAFQVVLAQRFTAECKAQPLDVYRVLRHLNPSPYLYLLNCVDNRQQPFAIVGSSPEALITVKNNTVLTHPIAGSRPRGSNPQEDKALIADLLADEKERSEHVMLVDLSRNDLSRVCEPGTVTVTEFMQVERFSHVLHLCSTVSGVLRKGVNAVTALEATFPAGTLSGAPKPWALRIITELEQAPRGVYGGVVGYFAGNGDADLAIAIRTAVLQNGQAFVQAGAGIVAESNPDSEDAECRNKAAAPLRAVLIANQLRTESE